MLLVLNGVPGSGKDTTANYLQYNYDFKKFSIAGSLKEQTILTFNLDITVKELDQLKDVPSDQLPSNINIGKHKTLRSALIAVGETTKKILGNKVYINLIINSIKEYLGEDYRKNVVITDVGFEPELYSLKDAFKPTRHTVYLARVHSDRVDNSILDSRVLLPYDYILNNNSVREVDSTVDSNLTNNSFQELYSNIDRLLSIIKTAELR